MGLSGRKVKQRISADPRNLGWADDAARFGSNYLSKFGWDASKGLGAGGDGMKSHIKVSHKLDMLGIGAAQTKDPNGIAWKQNRDFENLLQRLNEKLEAEQTPVADNTEESAVEAKSNVEGEEKKKKKRKHKETEDEDESEKKKKKKDENEGDGESGHLSAKVKSMQVDAVVETKTVVEVQKVVALPRHRAHRARLIAAKNIASKSAAHISEILGVAPESQVVSTSIAAPVGKLTSITDTDALGMDKLTTSTKNLADYFKEKLNARMGSSSGTSTPTAARADVIDAYDTPRGGIGASRMHLEIQSETKIEEETQRVGLSKFSSLMSSTFLAATSSISYIPPRTEQDEEMLEKDEGIAYISEVECDPETKEKSKKEKKRKDKKWRKEASDEDVKVREQEKKIKKDKKGKAKATEEVEEKEGDASEDEKRRKTEKKEKKKAAEEVLKTEAIKDDVEESSHKKEKNKPKPKKSDATITEPEDACKSKKEKKRRRTDS